MSSPLAPFTIPPLSHRKRLDNAMVSLPPLSTISGHQRAFSGYSSSPPRSSSPPMTPFSTRSSFSHAHIRSSPEIDYDYPSRHYGSSYDEPMSRLDRFSAHTFNKLPNTNVALPSLKSIMAEDLPFDTLPRVKTPPSTFNHDLPMARTYSSASAPESTDDSIFSEDEASQVQDEDEGFSFVETDMRATGFQMSEERGRWQYEPIPFKPDLRMTRTRHSAPTQPIPKSVPLPSRPASEPAPSTTRTVTPVNQPISLTAADSAPEQEPSSPLLQSVSTLLPHSDGCDSLPSLMSDAESVDREESHGPPSPLPPSSPPMSLYSLPSSPVMRSSSPLSLPPSSPVIAPIDYIHPEDNEPQEDDIASISAQNAPVLSSEAVIQIPDLNAESNLTRKIVSDAAPIISALSKSSPTLSPKLAAATQDASSQSSFEYSVFDDDVAMSPLTRSSTPVDDEPTDMQLDNGHMDLPHVVAVGTTSKNGAAVKSAEPMRPITNNHTATAPPSSSSKIDRPSPPADSQPQKAKSKGKSKEKRKQDEEHEDGPVKKKARAKATSDETAEKGKKAGKKVQREATESDDDDELPKPKAKKAKEPKSSAAAAESSSSSSSKSKSQTASSRPKKAKRPAPPPSPKKVKLPPLPAPDEALDAEICGMIIEGLATSRASSIPASKLYNSVMQARPSLKEQKSKEEWMEVIDRVLQNGEAVRGSGMFGKIESSFKDDSDRSLEAQWFYVPDLDPDQDRATLVKSMMPRAGKRAATMKYKQYYYAPLGKISRWDPEDEM